MDAGRFVSEHNALVSFVRRQQDRGKDTKAMLLGQRTTLLAQLATMPLQASEADQISEEIESSGVWDAEALEAFASALASRLVSPSHECPRGNKTQKCDYFDNYLLEEEWVQLDGLDLTEAISIVSSAAVRVGLRNLSEPTYKVMTALIASHCMRQPALDDRSLHDLCDSLKELTRATVARAGDAGPPLPWVENYPLDPQHLRPDLFAAAYPGAHPTGAGREISLI